MPVDATPAQTGGLLSRRLYVLEVETSGGYMMTAGAVPFTLIPSSRRRVAVEGDIVNHPSAYITNAGQSSVYAEAWLIAVQGASVSPHYYGGQLHTGVTVVGNLSSTVFAEGKPIALHDSTTSCNGAVIAVLNSSVFSS